MAAAGEPVEVWAAVLDPGRFDGSGCSHGEHDRAARFHSPLVGARWLAARHVLRIRLAVRLGCAPDAFEFEEGPHGKPRVPGIEFNLAHSGPIAVVAIAERAVGVDVEVPRAIVRPAGVARRLGLDPDTDPAAVLRAWTRTEALVKATGDGATGGLARVEERLAPARWVVVDLDLGAGAGPGTQAAVAARGRDWRVVGPRWI